MLNTAQHALLVVNAQHVRTDTLNLEILAALVMILKNVLAQAIIHYLIVLLLINGENISQQVLLFHQLLH